METKKITIKDAKFIKANGNKLTGLSGFPRWDISQFYAMNNCSIYENAISGEFNGDGLYFFKVKMSDTARNLLFN